MENSAKVLYANVLLVSGHKAWHRCGHRDRVRPALSASNQCCLTRRSTGPATAGGVSLARSGFATVARQAYTACLRGPVSSNVTVKAHPVEGELNPPADRQDCQGRWARPLVSAATQALAVAGSLLGAGHLPMSLSCLIQRGAFFFALIAA